MVQALVVFTVLPFWGSNQKVERFLLGLAPDAKSSRTVDGDQPSNQPSNQPSRPSSRVRISQGVKTQR
jgi:hypothetical protein